MKSLGLIATVALAGTFVASPLLLNAQAQSQRARGVTSTKVSPPKLVSTKVTEQRRVTTEVGKPKVTSKTKIETKISRLPSTTGQRQASAKRSPAVRQVAARPQAKPGGPAGASGPVAQGKSPSATTAQAADKGTPIMLRDSARLRFTTGDFYERQ